jgi:hypothetical protein
MKAAASKQRRKRAPKPDRRQALELLASSRDGCTEAIMLAHGFTVELLVDLVEDGPDGPRAPEGHKEPPGPQGGHGTKRGAPVSRPGTNAGGPYAGLTHACHAVS